MTSVQDKVAIVTGGSRGIGEATALALAGNGASVVICSRTESHLDGIRKKLEAVGKKFLVVRADVSVESDVEALISAAARQFGRIDILVNNAGIGRFANVAELSTGDFDSMWGVNMRGAFLCSRAVIPFMQKQNAGDIINIASLAGRNAFTGGAGYCATKWALIGFARCLMLEVRQWNIRVVTICPGSVDTQFADTSSAAHRSSGNIPKAEDIAEVVIDTLRMPRNVMVSEVDVRPTNPKA